MQSYRSTSNLHELEYFCNEEYSSSIVYGNNINYANAKIDTAINDALEGYTSSQNYRRNTVALFRAVIMQSILDAVSRSKRTEDKIARANAIRWLESKNQDFQTICLLADFNPDWVIKKSRIAIQRMELEKKDCNKGSWYKSGATRK